MDLNDVIKVHQLDKVSVKEFLALAEKVNTEKPTKADRKAFEAALEKRPELWHILGNVTMITAFDLIEKMYSERQQAGQISLRTRWAHLLAEMGYPKAPPHEQLLIEHAALCWLRHQWTEYRYGVANSGDMTLTKASYWERKLSASQRRYLRSIETLARVRKVTRTTPGLQINIAGQQVVMNG